MNDEIYQVATAMEMFGGGFVKALSKALIRADSDNTQRIKKAFPEYWAKYLKLYRSDIGEKNE